MRHARGLAQGLAPCHPAGSAILNITVIAVQKMPLIWAMVVLTYQLGWQLPHRLGVVPFLEL